MVIVSICILTAYLQNNAILKLSQPHYQTQIFTLTIVKNMCPPTVFYIRAVCSEVSLIHTRDTCFLLIMYHLKLLSKYCFMNLRFFIVLIVQLPVVSSILYQRTEFSDTLQRCGTTGIVICGRR